MKKQMLLFAVSLLTNHVAHAIWTGDNGVSIVGPFTYQADGESGGPAFLTTGTPLTLLGVDTKVVLNAREDAYYFVATGGQAKTVVLTQALNAIREANPQATVSDLELAQALFELQ
jgi:Protein of unknown function (DUF2388).